MAKLGLGRSSGHFPHGFRCSQIRPLMQLDETSFSRDQPTFDSPGPPPPPPPYDDVNAAMTTKPVCHMIWKIPSHRAPEPPPKPPPNKKRKKSFPPSPPGKKRCSTCSHEFDESHFINDKTKRPKLTKTCKTCRVDNRARVKKSRQNTTSKYHP